MSFLIRLSQSKLPAVIAILAILMLFIAPEISRSLQPPTTELSAGESAHTHNTMTTMMPGMPMPVATEKHTATTPAPMTDPLSGMDDIACGYCVMLLHMPVLLAMLVFLCWFSFLLCRTPTVRRRVLLPVRLFTGDRQPRAPPACC